MAKNYYDQAKNQYDPSYNAQINAMQNAYNNNKLNLENSKGGINENYDYRVGQQNLNNKMNKNNVSNTMLGRGLGNSSIAVSGLAEQDAKNTRLVGDINRARTGDLNNVDSQIAMLGQNFNNSKAQMEADREKELWAIAQKLEDRDWDKTFKDNQFNWQKEQGLAEQRFKEQQLAIQRQNAQAEQAYKNAVLDMQRKEFEAKNQKKNPMNDYINALGAIKGNTSYDEKTKWNMMNSLYEQAKMDNQYNQYGGDFDKLVNDLWTQQEGYYYNNYYPEGKNSTVKSRSSDNSGGIQLFNNHKGVVDSIMNWFK